MQKSPSTLKMYADKSKASLKNQFINRSIVKNSSLSKLNAQNFKNQIIQQ
jgi:hypothetical protein